MEYAVIDPKDESVIAIRSFAAPLANEEYNTRETAATNGKPFLLPLLLLGNSPFDPAAQIRTGPTYEVTAAECRAVYTVRDKTAGELDGEKEQAAVGDLNPKALRVVAAILLDHENRIRTLEGQPPVTAVDFRRAVLDRHKALS